MADFGWKDVAAAERLGIPLEEYVVGGMDPDFREQLYAMGKAMDAAGLNWTILSGFRDDYRQSLTVGYHAHVGNSFHGGSFATGGYGHGCAVDLGSADRNLNSVVWDWLQRHAGQFGLFRPLRAADPAHVQPHGNWHEFASKLRDERGGSNPDLGDPATTASVTRASDAGITDDQFNCVRPRPVLLAAATHCSSADVRRPELPHLPRVDPG